MIALLLFLSGAAAHAEPAPPSLVNIVQFTRGATFLDVRRYRQVLDPISGALFPEEEEPCEFDRPPGTAPVDYWYYDASFTSTLAPLTAGQKAALREAARRRNEAVYRHFPDWASAQVKLAIATYDVMTNAEAGETRAIYIALGKVRGRYVKPGGEQNFEFRNHGEYVVERDGDDTKGYLPVALCALLRTPRVY